MKALLSAYACLPNRGTEPGNGWGLAVNLAQLGLEVHVLTCLDNRDKIAEQLSKAVIPGVQFHYVGHPLAMARSEEVRYLLWQFAAVKPAKALNAKEHFDVVHHITYASIHVPTQLWRIGVPVVCGPFGGGQTAPERMRVYFGAQKSRERV